LKKLKKLKKSSNSFKKIEKKAVIKIDIRESKDARKRFHIGIFVEGKLALSFLLPESAISGLCCPYTPLCGSLQQLLNDYNYVKNGLL